MMILDFCQGSGVVGLKRTWDQKLSSGSLLTFMSIPIPIRRNRAILVDHFDVLQDV